MSKNWLLFENLSKAIEDARCTSSATVSVKPKDAFQLLSNPVYEKLQLQDNEKFVRVEIIDSNGSSVLINTLNFDLPIDVAALAQGTYTVIGWYADGQGMAKRFVKL